MGADTIYFIPQHTVPVGTKVTYTDFIYGMHPLKEEEHIVCTTIGGDKLEYMFLDYTSTHP